MSNIGDQQGEWPDSQYAQALAGEGEYWDNFIAQRLLRGEIPGSIDWRLNFTQFRFNHKWLPFCLGPQGINFRMREIHYILSMVTKPGMRILDLGCGAGWLSLELARRGAHVTGLDVSPTNLALARYMAETNTRNSPFLYQGFAGFPCRLQDFGSLEFSYADLNTTDLPTGEYDAVVVWDSLHHVSNLERLLEQVRKTLKPNGFFVGVDHAYASPRTEEFNRALFPWLVDLCSWITEQDPEWLYDGVAELGRQHNWGVLAIDYDPTPIPGFEPFQEQLLAEMLGIIRGNLRQETLSRAKEPSDVEEESPFEDVSAERVIQVLLEQFQALRFETVCPLIQPEQHIPHYRSEKERIFQHYMASMLTKIGESAVNRGQADGQWFLFHLTRERPGEFNELLEAELNRKNMGVDERLAYITRLESELERKNAAIAKLEARLQQPRSLLSRVAQIWKRQR